MEKCLTVVIYHFLALLASVLREPVGEAVKKEATLMRLAFECGLGKGCLFLIGAE